MRLPRPGQTALLQCKTSCALFAADVSRHFVVGIVELPQTATEFESLEVLCTDSAELGLMNELRN